MTHQLRFGGGQRVLLIEDDADTAEMYRIGLELSGYQVAVAGDGESALSATVDQRNIDVVVLDLTLPRTDGLEVLVVLDEIGFTAAIPIIVLSNRLDDFASALAHGAVQCLKKSTTTPSQLADHIRTVATEYLKGA